MKLKDFISVTLFLLAILSSEYLHGTASAVPSEPDSSSVNKKYLYRALAFDAGYYATAMVVMQQTWYKGREIVPFHFYNDNKGYLQVDKFGHAYGAYVESYNAFQYFLTSGMPRSKALIYGGSLGLILQTPIEIMDGIHEGWGFSWGDMAANALGSGLIISQELLFREQIVKYKFSYSESRYSKMANGYLGETTLDRFLKDYNGHTYWLSMPVNRLAGKDIAPDWLCLSVGYGANGMYGEYENISSYNGIAIPPAVRYRQYLMSLDIEWDNIRTNSRFLRAVFKGMTFIKIPFPALEYSSSGDFRAYWIYF